MIKVTLKDKIVLITGASSGIGEATARALASTGAHLILCARRKDRLEKLAGELHTTVKILPLDVSNKKSVEEALSNIGPIDILINNAGLARGINKFQETQAEDCEEMIDTNLKGLLYVTRKLLPSMIERNKGHIINLGSIAGREVYPGGNVYLATKHAVHSFTQALRLDLLGYNIRVSLIAPGLVETEFSQVRFRGDKTLAKVPYHGMKPLVAEDIADAIVYALTCPEHVNISEIFLTPTAQASASMVHRVILANNRQKNS